MKITMIYASTTNGLIGDGDKLPWHIKEDFKHFVKYTKGKTILMGSKTANTLPGGPLPNRMNYVLTRRDLRNYPIHDAKSFNYINNIPSGCDELMVIGGSEIYSMFESVCDEIIWTEVHGEYDGDVFYNPKLNWQKEELGKSTCGSCTFWRLYN